MEARCPRKLFSAEFQIIYSIFKWFKASADQSVKVFFFMEISDYALLEEPFEREQRDTGNNGSFKILGEAKVTESRDDRVEKPALNIFNLKMALAGLKPNQEKYSRYYYSSNFSAEPVIFHYWVGPVPYLELLGRDQ